MGMIESVKAKHKRIKFAKHTVFVFAIFFLLLMTLVSRSNTEIKLPLPAAELLDLGEKYLLEMNYEQALVQFTKVIEVEPMNPRGYIGAAEAYVGLGDTKKAKAILQQGMDVLPNNDGITEMLSTLLPTQDDTSASEITPTSETKSLDEIAEQEPWRLFDNPLSASEIVFAGVPFWESDFDIVRAYYPDGMYSYKDAEGFIRDDDNNVRNGYMGWDRDYSAEGIQYSSEGDHMYGGFRGNSGIRNISMGMNLDEVTKALGFSTEGVEYVAESEKGIRFDMDAHGCFSVSASEYSSRDFYFGFGFYPENNIYVWFNVCFNDGVVSLIEIQMSKPNN